MNNEHRQFLHLFNRPPARLNAEQTAIFLNFQPHDIPVLVAVKLLKTLGNPPPNGQKFFATQEILALAEDRNWLARATLGSLPSSQESAEGILLFRGRQAAILRGPAHVQLAYPFQVQPLPESEVSYWEDLRQERFQFTFVYP